MPRFLTARTLLWIGLPVILLVASCGAAFGAVRLARSEGDRLRILGSGDGVSVLITTGRAELLIATGTDRTAFGNAYDHVSIAPRAQPDILLVAGTDRSLNVPTSAIDLFADANTYAIHPLQTDLTGEITLGTLSHLPRNPVRFTLDQRIVVVVESLPIDDDDGGFAWRAQITRESSRIEVISSLEHATLFTWTDPVSVLVVAGDASNPDSSPIGTTSIIGSAVTLGPPDESVSPGTDGGDPMHVVPVRPGSVATVTFDDSGVELTSDDRMYSSGQSD